MVDQSETAIEHEPMYCPSCDGMVEEWWDRYDETFSCPECRSLTYEDKEEYIEVLHGIARWKRNHEPVTDGGEVERVLYHPGADVEFEYGKRQSFKLANEDDPDEYWYVVKRVWNYDAEIDDAVAHEKQHKQYEIAEVSSLGGNPRLVSEATLDQHYEPVDKETAQEVV